MKKMILGLIVVLCVGLMASMAFAQTVTVGGGATGTVYGGVLAYQAPKGDFNVNIGGHHQGLRIDVDHSAVQVGVIGSYSQSVAQPSAVIATGSVGDPPTETIDTTTNASAGTLFTGNYSQRQSTSHGGTQSQSASSTSITFAATGHSGVDTVEAEISSRGLFGNSGHH